MATICTKIINGEIPCYKVAENERFFAFLDINPLVKGHTLVIPKQVVDDIFDLSDKDLADLNIFAKSLATAIKDPITCKRIGITVMGMEVPHSDMHLIPINQASEMIISNP